MYVNKFCAQFNNTYKSKFYSLNSSSKKKRLEITRCFIFLQAKKMNKQVGFVNTQSLISLHVKVVLKNWITTNYGLEYILK